MWAADDYVLFKQLMVKHNLELEMQTANYLSFQNDETSGNYIAIIIIPTIFFETSLCLKGFKTK